MARKQKNHAPSASSVVSADSRRRQVELLIEKGKAKEAFKEAKNYFHLDASPEHRQLVERTYLLRIQALIRDGMVSAGREVATSMLEFGVRDPELLREVVHLLPQLGMVDKALALQEQLQAPESKAELWLKLADRSVLHPEDVRVSIPELHEAASPVRLALAALESGNEIQALELLQPIPRSSPMADWRYFVRGLIAFRKNDLDQAKANWDRLEPQRAARKISRALLSLSDERLSVESTRHLKALELGTYGEAVLDRLQDLRKAIEKSDWKRVLHNIGPLRRCLERIDPLYSQRLTDSLLLPLSEEIKNLSERDAQRFFAEFKAVLEPLSWDPKWHRFEAILWEGAEGNLEFAVDCWRKYIQDLECGIAAPLGESSQVQAQVWLRIGDILSDLANDDEFPLGPRNQFANQQDFGTQAVEALRKSVRLDPKQRKAYQLLIDNYTDWNQPENVIAALEDLLKAFPDDVDAYRQLIRQYQDCDKPELVLRNVERLRALKPLDTRLNWEETWGRLALARHSALKKQWEEGRAEFARVEMSLKEYFENYRLLSRRAAFEFKAGDAAQAEKYIERAKSEVKEPTVLWLALAIESARYELPQILQQRFNQEFKPAVGRKVTSETAGALAELLASYSVGRLNYPGRDGHIRDVVAYLKRTTRLKYQEPDLRHACTFLHLVGKIVGKQDKLLATLSKRGQKLFPSSPLFILMETEIELTKGPMSFNAYQTEKKLQKALALAEASQNPKDSELISTIKQFLVRVRDVSSMMGSFPFLGRKVPNNPQDLFNMFEEMFDDSHGMEPDFEEDNPDADRSNPPAKRKPR